MTPTWIINSYAGSLVIAASDLPNDLEIQASLEDDGYGIPVQRANFPDLTYHETRAAWPTPHMKGSIVIAHPPCAAFSAQNYSNAPHAMGVDAKKFQCTIDVMKYAMGGGAKVLLIESVMGALEGAREIHDSVAHQFGYDVYRVVQNAASFGVPQWRNRFWCVFAKRGEVPEVLPILLKPDFTVLSQVLPIEPTDQPDPRMQWEVQEQFAHLFRKGVTVRQLANILWSDKYGMLIALLRKELGLKEASFWVMREYTLKAFMTNTLRVLPWHGLSTVLLNESLWWWNGRLLTPNDFKLIMGFPVDYQFPDKHLRQMRGYLSRGVCPPVAKWLLEQILFWIAGGEHPRYAQEAPDTLYVDLRPGEIADVRPSKKEIEVPVDEDA
jgi:site-specific DNA-cytosine methylase